MRKTISFILLSVLLLLAVRPICTVADEDKKTVVRVGWFIYPGSSEVKDGKCVGYTYDFLMEIAKYTDWEYEFVQADLATCCEMLAKGEIDILGGLEKTDERELFFDYSDMPFSQTYLTMFTNKDSDLQEYDYDNYDGIRIGILGGSSNRANVTKLANENSFTCSIKEYNTNEEIHNAINEGEIDAGVLLSYVASVNTRTLARFAPISIHFITTKGNKAVLSGINRGMTQIRINRPDFESKLYQKYFVKDENVDLTEAEMEIVNNSMTNPLRVGVIDNCAPISYWNSKRDDCEGLAVEIFDTICRKTGLNVEYVPMDMSELEDIASKKDDLPPLVLGIGLSDLENYDNRLYFSEPLLETPMAIVGRGGTDFTKANGPDGTIAVVENFTIAQTYINQKLSGLKIVEYPTLEDCMLAVTNGEVDATIHYQSCIIYFLQKPLFSELKFVPVNSTNTSLCMTGLSDNRKLLIRIIDKGLAKVSDSELQELALNITMLNTYPLTLEDILYEYRLHLIIIGVLLVMMITAFIALYSVKRNSSEKLAIAYKQKNEALIEAQKASSAKGAFMSSMSHEMRTPLNAVIGYNTVARNEMVEAKTDEERRMSEAKVMECLTKSDIASKHLLTIINDVLDMSAIEGGKITAVNEQFNFKGLVASITALFYSQAKSKNVDFLVQIDQQMDEWIVGDQMRVNQILTNLLSNAIKFTPKDGKVTLLIQPKTEQDSIQIHFEVSDTGIGMSEEYLKRIWTPFEQADSSISRRFGGTGLGLSITKMLVDILGGTITVESIVGKGTQFGVNLTFARIDQPEETNTYDFASIKALIIDDGKIEREYIRTLFTHIGIADKTICESEEAVKIAKQAADTNKPYTLCLLDCNLKQIDNLKIARDLLKATQNNTPTIVLMTCDFTEVADKAAKLGIEKFISKPLFQSSLHELITDISKKSVADTGKKPNIPNFSGARVLLAEDNSMNMEIATNILESAKLSVDKAMNGQEAVDMFLSSKPGTYSVILMDVQMPVLDGYGATRQIRTSKHPEAMTIPIIAMTADAFAENIAESHDAGMNDHISKPIDFKLLYQTLNRYI